MTELATTLRERRKSMRMTLDELATKARCSKAYLSGIENDKFPHPPSTAMLKRIERGLKMEAGSLQRLADWQETPRSVKQMLTEIGVDIARYGFGERGAAGGRRRGPASPAVLQKVPLINRMAAGVATEFTDLDFPVNVADEYVPAPVDDPRAFAATVEGDSMAPQYQDGDVVVFSPRKDARDGCDCFVRLLPDYESTFKRVHFEADGRVRLEPLNKSHSQRLVPRDQIAGLYPAVAVIKSVGR
jgi:repressor LexA